MNLSSWDLFEQAMAHGARRVMIWGPKGLAKSYNAQRALHASKQQVSQVTLNDDIAAQELMGHYIPMGDHFAWHDGPITEAYRKGFGLVVNELSRASGAVQDMFLGVLDDFRVSNMTLPNGERVKPGKTFRVVAASNHDPNQMDEALVDRFDAIIHVTSPHPSLVEYMDNEYPNLGHVVELSYKTPATAISPRKALSFLYFMQNKVVPEVAAQLAFGNQGPDVLLAIKAVTKK